MIRTRDLVLKPAHDRRIHDPRQLEFVWKGDADPSPMTGLRPAPLQDRDRQGRVAGNQPQPRGPYRNVSHKI